MVLVLTPWNDTDDGDDDNDCINDDDCDSNDNNDIETHLEIFFVFCFF